MCLTHFSSAWASLALGYWIAVAEAQGAPLLAEATVLRGFRVSLPPNPIFSGLVRKRRKASLGTVGASWLDAETRGWGQKRSWTLAVPGSSCPSLAVVPAVAWPPPALAQWPRSAIPHGFPGCPRGRAPAGRALAPRLPVIQHDSSIRDEMRAKSFSV